MHNRVRMITASFLVKNLHVDWREGAKYFAEKLIDYDPAVNNGNWQWVSSSGYESHAYYRHLNPNNDLKKFDPKCLYVKKYISELRGEDISNIHLGVYSEKCKYPTKIINFSDTIEQFKLGVTESAE